MADGIVRGPLATKVNHLFTVVRPANGDEYTFDEVAEAIKAQGGPTISATYLWQLRTGRRDNPTKRHLEALAQFFHVPVAYFFDDDQGAATARELELLGALRDAGVRSVALRAVNLSREGIDTISEIIDVLARREKGADPAPGADGEDRD